MKANLIHTETRFYVEYTGELRCVGCPFFVSASSIDAVRAALTDHEVVSIYHDAMNLPVLFVTRQTLSKT